MGGGVGARGHGGAVRRRWRGRFGPWEAHTACFCPWLRDGRAFMSFLRVLRTLWAVACAHRVAQTFCYTWVCVLCVYEAGIAAFFYHRGAYPWLCNYELCNS